MFADVFKIKLGSIPDGADQVRNPYDRMISRAKRSLFKGERLLFIVAFYDTIH